jgi:hypothetical protein
MSKIPVTERADAIHALKHDIKLKPGETVWTVLRHASASGMSRTIDLFVIRPRYENTYPLKPEAEQSFPGERDYSAKPTRKLLFHEPRRISHLVARAVGYGFDRDRMGIKSSGGGMDMGFEAVYNLGYALWPKGVKSGYAGKPETDGGYALRHEWF